MVTWRKSPVWDLAPGDEPGPRLRHLIAGVVLLAIGTVVGTLGNISLGAGNSVSRFWPAMTIQSAGAIWFGGWGVAAGTLIGLVSGIAAGAPPAALWGFRIGDFLQGFLVAWVFRRWRLDPSLPSRRELAVFLGVGALLSNAVGSVVGLLPSVLSGEIAAADFPLRAFAWFVGNSLPCVVLGPLLLRSLSPLIVASPFFCKRWWGGSPPLRWPGMRNAALAIRLLFGFVPAAVGPLVVLAVVDAWTVTEHMSSFFATQLLPVLINLSLFLSLIAMGRVSRGIAAPVEELDAAARRIGDGDLDVRVAVTSDDELGRLCGAFNRMAEGLSERERITRTFKRYLAPEVVDHLLSHPEAQNLGGRRQHLSVLFSDLVSFTSFAESEDPQTVLLLLNDYFGRVGARVMARGGTIDKYMGDGLMAFFGAPAPSTHHALDACLVALDHVAVLDELNRLHARPRLAARIGINTGEVIVGNVGGAESREYTVIGDVVNVAARLESANREYGTRVLVTEATWREARHGLDGREIGPMMVRGRRGSLRVYEVLGERGCLAADTTLCRVVSAYEEALRHFGAGRFAPALDALEAALRARPEDGPSLALHRRVLEARGAHPRPIGDEGFSVPPETA